MSDDRPQRGQASDNPELRRELRDGVSDGLIPLETLDVAGAKDVDELVAAMSMTAFGGRRMGEAAEVLYEMITDPECSVVLTLSGAMTVAKMGLLITEMIERGWVQAVVSTGALMTHGLVEIAGMGHFKASAAKDDELFHKGYLRVYDTYELEANLNQLERLLHGQVFPTMEPGKRFGSRELCAMIGKALAKPGVRGIMASAWRSGVPVYIPAFTDSELGLDVATWFLGQQLKAKNLETAKTEMANLHTDFDPFRDVGHFARIVTDSPRMGIFTIGGGVPRNWAQQAPPFIDIMNTALDKKAPFNRYRYGVRICPEPVHWGGLSGCTYSEGVSWGKFIPEAEGGRYAEVASDATIAWPLVVKAVMQRLEKTGAEVRSPDLDLDGCKPNP